MAAITCPSCRQTFEGTGDPLAVCPFCGGSLAPPPQTYDPRRGIDLREVAKRQRSLLWYVLASLLIQVALCTGGFAFHPILAAATGLAFWTLQIIIIVGVVRLLIALGVNVVWCVISALLLLAPCINLLLLLAINRQATSALKKAGLRVGLMGVPDEQVVRRMSIHICRSCGYNLTGNISGVCPECGTAIDAQVPHS